MFVAILYPMLLPCNKVLWNDDDGKSLSSHASGLRVLYHLFQPAQMRLVKTLRFYSRILCVIMVRDKYSFDVSGRESIIPFVSSSIGTPLSHFLDPLFFFCNLIYILSSKVSKTGPVNCG